MNSSGVPSYSDRVLGCLLGGAVGDALGAPVEFKRLTAIRAQHGPQGVTGYARAYGGLDKITDDTQMSILTVEGIRRALDNGSQVVREVFPLYRDWADGQQVGEWSPDADPWLRDKPVLLAERAPGNACLSGLTAGWMATADHPVNPQSAGCGTVMRSAPFGLVRSWSPEESFEHAVECSLLSHGHDTASASAGALAMILRRLLDGTSLRVATEQTMAYLDQRPGLDVTDTVVKLNKALVRSQHTEASAEDMEALGDDWERHREPGHGWTADEALAMGLFAALVYEHDPRAALLLSINHSGDSDSTGSICGNLLGTAHGIAALPAEWVDQNEARELLTALADSMAVVE